MKFKIILGFLFISLVLITYGIELNDSMYYFLAWIPLIPAFVLYVSERAVSTGRKS